MTRDEIKELMTFFDETNINRIKIKDKEFEIELEKYEPEAAPAPVVCPPVPAPTPINVNVVNEKSASSQSLSGDTLTSPMVGTFYVAPSPGAASFVKVGQTVRKGDCIGIIEAMKIMNEIEAEYDCRIIKALVADGQPVEFGMALYEVEKI
ncbi:acetyl-CoA carboxylase%2C biotin carboxyl carrier protein [Campylobacter hyointestinalis]|uniref:Biotin carboxyl carrier protein of acetyl-CoA carboxylase n=1 Tax=Campylobacter hyointestinalis subsp. hyointestinalis TaxID=91352 RepID=A0A855N3I8_CAMHY|nr:acetyl-CoA carboxylase biotin carboxyl carrier protein [Campylobacter hyointestinalis]ANE33217.1 acetyl-CoA carboxylase, biotin carboxyl carrier protein [Campylobacter hyointestinalis subsp. hyointestinalis LMG 9260]KEA44717.1 acetyl-CoA carboxylase [Campylobacter hyointestinalis subsp. hyointestinalis]MBT0611317.1 acetyl-CoA carboxylase biotin carboxyl carrier protein [Campylobacter hyointestinalis subsp. hyointestinalis]MDL2346321.1 acetyl-CoA carboxylase biotin carboxyl carrier protein [C